MMKRKKTQTPNLPAVVGSTAIAVRPAELILPPSTLVLPAIVEETTAQAFLRRAAVMIAFAVLALIVWAGLAKVKEVAKARGMIVPAGLERTVQHYEGGMVSQILVQAGDRVEKGQPLVVLDDATTSEDQTVVAEQTGDAEAELEAMLALLEKRQPVLGSYDADSAKRARETFDAMLAAQASQRSLYDSQTQQAQSQVKQADVALAALADDRAFAVDNASRIEGLVAKGYATRASLAERRKAVSETDTKIQLAQSRRDDAISKVTEVARALAAYEAAINADLDSRIQDLRTRVTALKGELAKVEKRHGRLSVTAPVTGLVKSLEVSTIGGVVAPGQPLATIVPLDEVLYAEARVPVSQIGHVATGLSVHVKVSAFDFTRFGWLNGTVAEVSPSSFVTGQEEPFYKVRIKLASDVLPFAADARLVPGMTIDADIVTGERTVLGYLLSPINRAFGSALREG